MLITLRVDKRTQRRERRILEVKRKTGKVKLELEISAFKLRKANHFAGVGVRPAPSCLPVSTQKPPGSLLSPDNGPNLFVFVLSGTVKEEDCMRYPPHGYPLMSYKASPWSQRRKPALSVTQRPVGQGPSRFHSHAKNNFKYWYDEKRPLARKL